MKRLNNAWTNALQDMLLYFSISIIVTSIAINNNPRTATLYRNNIIPKLYRTTSKLTWARNSYI